MKHFLSKLLVLLVFAIVIFASSSTAYSYFDDLSNEDSESIPIGEWYVGISTAQEFYDFATKSNSVAEDYYYLENDIDFTGFTWELDATNSTSVFRGLFDGDNHTLSNLTIYTDILTYKYLGLFSRINGGTVKNLKLDNVDLEIDSTALTSNSYRSGLIAGDVQGDSTISNITISDCSVMANRGAGGGGVVGYVLGAVTDLTISNVKATGLKIFSIKNNIGGVIGQINKSVSSVTVTDVDIEGDFYTSDTPSYAGGVVGKSELGATLTIENAIVEMNPQNTLLTSLEYLDHCRKHNGGILGYNQGDATISYTFFTGNLITEVSGKGDNVGTTIGRDLGTSSTLSDNYYSQTQFLNVNGSILYTPDPTSTGVFGTAVNGSSMPSSTWWDTFASNFDSNLWDQDANGRLYLIR